MSIYGSNKEDQYQLSKLLNYTDGGNMEVNETIELDDFQVVAAGEAYSINGCVQIIEGEFIRVLVDSALIWNESDQSWSSVEVGEFLVDECESAWKELQDFQF